MSSEPEFVIPSGFRAAAVKAGIKPSGGLDLAVLASDLPCAAAGTFTTNRVCAAPVRWDQPLVPSDSIRAIVVNATGAVAALLADCGVPQEILRGFAVVARAAGLVGHVREEQTKPAMRALWEGADRAVPYRDPHVRDPSDPDRDD